MAPKETYDDSLFPDAKSASEAASMWEDGKNQPQKLNPVGTFQVEIVTAEMGRSQSSERLQIHYELEILVGEHKGKKLHKYDGLGSPEQTDITQKQMKRVGIDSAKLKFEQLPAALLTLKGKRAVVQTKYNQDFYNIYFQKLITTAVTPGGGDTAKGSKAAASKSKRF